MTVIHDFPQDIRESLKIAQYPFWCEVYRQAFPDFKSMRNLYDNERAQEVGVDREVILQGGKKVWTEEKYRKVDYKDILLEFYSSYEARTPGWIEKESWADWLAYAVLPRQICYLLPYQQLQEVYEDHKKEWKKKAEEETDGFRIVDGNNGYYTSKSIAVPLRALFEAELPFERIRWGRLN